MYIKKKKNIQHESRQITIFLPRSFLVYVENKNFESRSRRCQFFTISKFAPHFQKSRISIPTTDRTRARIVKRTKRRMRNECHWCRLQNGSSVARPEHTRALWTAPLRRVNRNRRNKDHRPGSGAHTTTTTTMLVVFHHR